MINLEKAAEVIYAQAMRRSEFSDLDPSSKLEQMTQDKDRVIQTLTHKWLGCISLIKELKSHPDVIAAGIEDLPSDYILEKLAGPKADEGKLLTDTAQAMARSILDAALKRIMS
ncbi:hypothetical protein A9Q97_06165 [Rhodospirillales bacterium 47_12_T64]|nr:hypothetical protein A9Q97_06165 [Rhodospirillales bacterium 47_12_T64]